MKRENLAIDDHVCGNIDGRGSDLGKLARHILEVPAVQGHSFTAPVQLASDSVVFVFNPDLLPHACDRLLRVSDRGREHEPQRHEPLRPSVCQRSMHGETRHLAHVAHEHHRAAHRGRLRTERHAHRLLDQALAEPNAHVS